jgi:hypothetical protein
MSKHSILAIALATALTVPAVASAQSGFFVDGGVGQVRVDESGFDDKDTHFRLGGGWQWNQYFGLEAGWADLGSFSEQVAIGAATGEFEADGWYAGVRAKVPFYEGDRGFYARARAGILWWDATGRARAGTVLVRFDDSGNDPYFGIGAGYDLSSNFGVGLDYDRYKIGNGGDDATLKVWSVNATYRF